MMSPRAKSTLLLAATLVIGLVLGALVNGYFVRQRLDRIGDLMTPDGFRGRIEEAIKPANEEQLEAVRKVFDAAAPRSISIMRESRARMRALHDSVRSELENILSEEQMQRLDERMRLRRRGPFQPGLPPILQDSTGRRGGRGRRHRFPGDRPPPPPADSLVERTPARPGG